MKMDNLLTAKNAKIEIENKNYNIIFNNGERVNFK